MDINVALLPDENLARTLAELSALLADGAGNSLVLQPDAPPHPHLTLYMTGYEPDCVPLIEPLVRNNVADVRDVAIHVRRAMVSPQGTVLALVDRSAALDHLHRWMIHKLQPLHGNARAAIWEDRRDRLNPEEQARLDHIGFPQSLDAWSPHFTIGKVPPERIEAARALLGDVRAVGYARAIAVGDVGPHGSLTSVRGEIPLGM